MFVGPCPPTWLFLHHENRMQLPRRTPFYAPANEELAQVHTLLLRDGNDTESVQKALRIVRLWMNRAACPQAVEATALLVQAHVLDQAAGASEGTRAAYAMAIVRFVNSVVDSFQTGMYAQSIGAIADRIGMPQWLVQVRHSATHEELPSMDACRDACAMSLQWLDQHYWHTTLYPSAPMAEGPEDDVDAYRPEAAAAAAQLLHAFRVQSQEMARDRSLAVRGVPPVVKTVAELEQWVQQETARRLALAADKQAHVLADGAARRRDDGWGSEAVQTCTASVLMMLVTQLLLPGALIPQSKEQRALAPRADASQLPALPDEHLRVWDPLLHALHTAFPLFLPITIQALASVGGTGTTSKSRSFANVACAWLAHLALDAPYDTLYTAVDVPRWRDLPCADGLPAAPEDAEAVPVWSATHSGAPLRRIVLQHCMEAASEPTFALAQYLAEGAMAERVRALIALHQAGTTETQTGLGEMEARAEALHNPHALHTPVLPARASPAEEAAALPCALPGWSLAPAWQPTPIGCLGGQRPPLLLS